MSHPTQRPMGICVETRIHPMGRPCRITVGLLALKLGHYLLHTVSGCIPSSNLNHAVAVLCNRLFLSSSFSPLKKEVSRGCSFGQEKKNPTVTYHTYTRILRIPRRYRYLLCCLRKKDISVFFCSCGLAAVLFSGINCTWICDKLNPITTNGQRPTAIVNRRQPQQTHQSSSTVVAPQSTLNAERHSRSATT